MFNSCITYFSFLPRLRNISSMFLNLVSGELPSFFCFFVVFLFFFFSFSIFRFSLSSEFSILLTFILSSFFFSFFFRHFFAFILSNFSFIVICSWFPFFCPHQKNLPLSFSLSSFSVFLHLLVRQSLVFRIFRLYLFFFSLLFFFPFFLHFSFMSWDPWS